MIDIFWTILNIILFIVFLIIALRGIILIKKDLGIIAAIILLIGLINSGNSNKENKDFVPDNFHATVSYDDVIPLGKWQKIHLLIIKDVDSNQIQSGKTSMTGVECGIHWEEQQMKLFVVENGIGYKLTGYKQYSLLGFPVYKQMKCFDGVADLLFK